MSAYVSNKYQHGLKIWYHLTADSLDELKHFSRRLHLEIHGGFVTGKGIVCHLDLDEHDKELALRYGAMLEQYDYAE